MVDHKNRDRDNIFNWTLHHERTLINTLIKQLEAGKRADNDFKPEVWDAVLTAIQNDIEPPLVIQVRQCKNKYQWYRGMYKEWLQLKDQSGFGWDPETNRVTAPDQVRKSYLQVCNLIKIKSLELTN